MWGSSLLISPVLEENKRSVFAYFPEARWFDYYTGKEVMETKRVHELLAPLDYIPLHVRGNSIIVTQVPAINTELSRKNPFGLIIAPHQINKNVNFTLFYDDGETIGNKNNLNKSHKMFWRAKFVKPNVLRVVI